MFVMNQNNNNSISKKMQPDHAMRELASRICRDYLHGAWKEVTAQNVGFKHISGGLSNLLYHISLPEHLVKSEMAQGEPKEVLIRVYGQTHGGERALESLITESVIFTLLSERGLGPKLHGIFPGGRIEQYINARALKTRELSDEGLSTQIAEKMALIHSMEVPLHKDPGWLWETIERWLKSSQTQLKTKVPEMAQSLLDVDLQEEYRWLKKRLEDENCPVTFCHNDMQEGNILISQDENENNNAADQEDPKIVLIDFEYCSYNYRSFDIANHFVEWMYDYTEPESPFFRETVEHYPSEQQRLNFVKTYLKETGSGDSPKQVLREVKVFTMASHFFWTLWSIVNAETSQIPFGYWEYAVARMNAYKRSKKDISHSSTNQPLKRKALDP